MASAPITLRHLLPADVGLLRELNVLFGEAFADPVAYGAESPSDAYLEGLLAREHVVAVVALAGAEVVGGPVAYELDKFERMRRELYIYDLAVGTEHRRQGIATALIEHLRRIAARRGAWVVYVQATTAMIRPSRCTGSSGRARRCYTSTSGLNRNLPSRNNSECPWK
jgi:aminoglycoside 3-N-acetyltransferase I